MKKDIHKKTDFLHELITRVTGEVSSHFIIEIVNIKKYLYLCNRIEEMFRNKPA